MGTHFPLVWLLDFTTGAAQFGLNWLVQSSLVLAMGLIVGRMVRRRGSAAQSAVYRATLVAIGLCPLATWGLYAAGVSGWSIDLPTVAHSPQTPVVVDWEPAPTHDTSSPVAEPSPAVLLGPFSEDSADLVGTPPVSEAPELGAVAVPKGDVPTAEQASESRGPTIRYFGLIASASCLIWLTAAVAFLIRFVITWRRLARICDSARPAEPDVIGVCGEVARRIGVTAPIVKHSPYLNGPCLAGLRRAAVLLPESSLGMSLCDVLIHELAHLRRRDCHWNVVCRLALAVGFFQPLLWILVRRLQATSEEVCDDYVVQYGVDRQAYARGLVDIAALRLPSPIAAGMGIISFRSMLGTRVTRIMDTSRVLSTRAGRRFLVAVIVGGLLGTAAVGLLGVGPQPSLAVAEETPNADGAADTKDSPERATADESKEAQRVSMSAAEFARLSAKEQRALLVRVFKGRMKHAKNFYYEEIRATRGYTSRDGKPVEPLKWAAYCRNRHWRLGDSFRVDTDTYRNVDDAQPKGHSCVGVNAVEGLGRNASSDKDSKHPPHGQVRYFFESPGNSRYFFWLGNQDSPAQPWEDDAYLFPCLLKHQNEFEIDTSIGDDKVLLSFPWKPSWAKHAGGERAYVLDPRKGFLPVSCVAFHHDPPTEKHPMWREERFEVKESRLVGDLWMPTKITETLSTSSVPDMINVDALDVSNIRFGKVSLADIRVPFPEGTHVADTVEKVRYVTDAEGKPGGPVKPSPNWGGPTKEWTERYGEAYERGKEQFTMASRLTAADRQMLRDAKREKQERQRPINELLAVLRADPPPAEPERIEAALKILRIYRPGEQEVAWASAIRELIVIGPPAVPKLIEELDRTEKPSTLRALGFVLRGIGDRRAIPAMIRAIPRLLVPSSSDYGLIVEGDPELNQFMQRYDNDEGERGKWFGYNRPIREIMPALAKLTGESHGWMELNYVDLQGGASQQRIQRQLYLKLARRWADWWSKHWQQHVENQAAAELDQITQALDEYEKSIPAAPAIVRSEFPTGPNVTLGGGCCDAHSRSFDQSTRNAFRDLDSGRQPRPSAALIKSSPGLELSKELLAWAQRQGVDLVTIRIKPQRSEELVYAFQPIGMKVWRIENDRYDNLEKELRATKKLELPEPWTGPLAQFDEKTGKYNGELTVSFLFITKEGTCGAIQIQSPVSRKIARGAYSAADGGLHYQFIYESKGPNAKAATALPSGEQHEITMVGRVVAPDGKPVAGADVAAVGFTNRPERGGDLGPESEVLEQAITGADGRYRFTIRGVSSKTHRYTNVVVCADGLGCAWRPFNPDADKFNLTFKLVEEQPIHGRLLDRQGRPAGGVRLWVRSVSRTTKGGTMPEGVGYRNDQNQPKAWPQTVTTDTEGRFAIHNVAPDNGVLLHIGGTESVARQDLAINTGMPEKREKDDQTYRSNVRNVELGEEVIFTLAPAQIFEGTVRYEDTGKPAPHARLTIWASQQKPFGSMISVAGRADGEGRYRIMPYAGVRFGVTAYPPNGEPYLTRRVDDIAWEDGARVKQVDVALPRGILVRGKVVDSKSGKPIAGATVQYMPERKNNPHKKDDILTGWQGIQLSDETGQFQIVVLPGPGRLLVHGPGGEYVLKEIGSNELHEGRPGGRRYYAGAVEKVDPKPGADPIELTVPLERGETIVGGIVNPEGHSVDEALVISRLKVSPSSPYWRGHTRPTYAGRFELSGLAKGQKYPVYFLDPKNRLGATATLEAGDEPTIKLAPCGQACATFLDAKGQPKVDFRPSLHMVVTPGACTYDFTAARRGELAADEDSLSNIDRTNYWPGPKTDRQGRITFPALIPGATYRIYGMDSKKWGTRKEFTVKPGETVELGEVELGEIVIKK